jgi:hypothetical protein
VWIANNARFFFATVAVIILTALFLPGDSAWVANNNDNPTTVAPSPSLSPPPTPKLTTEPTPKPITHPTPDPTTELTDNGAAAYVGTDRVAASGSPCIGFVNEDQMHCTALL